MSEKTENMEFLHDCIESRDNEISTLKQTISDKDREIAELKRVGENLSKMFDAVHQTMMDGQKQIADLEKIKENREIAYNIVYARMKTAESLLSPNTQDEWSDWYEYKGEVDFQDGIFVNVFYENGCFVMVDKKDGFANDKNIHWKIVTKYRIKLDGVRVMKYADYLDDKYIGNVSAISVRKELIMGHDKSNKIVIAHEDDFIIVKQTDKDNE